MNKLSTIILGLSFLSVSAFAGSNGHMGNHMHEGKMTNHMSVMKDMDHSEMMKDMKIYHHIMKSSSYMVTLDSIKPLKDGKNNMSLMFSKNSKFTKVKDLSVKFFMPSMPGMDFVLKPKQMGKIHNMIVNFSMMGQWDYEIMFKSFDGKKHITKGSVNLK
ncbi:MAG: FixH family protein [Campylobacteraceae bacterium]|nr:FixH family protein [Campylobacteraceae bacterium]